MTSLALGLDEGRATQRRPLVVLLHGFPELPSSWHAQVGPLVAAGHRVVAPFLRGYGDSPAPADPAAYTADLLAEDVAGVIEGSGEERAIVIGHDWGAAVTWSAAQLRPERVAALVALSVPFTARSRRPPLQRLAEVMGDRFFYMLHFQRPGVADAELSADVRRFLLGMYAASSGSPPPGALRELPAVTGRFLDQLPEPDALPAWLPAAQLDEAVATFTRTGFTGALGYYRALDLSWERLPQLGEAVVGCPAGFVAGERDMVLAFTPTRAMGPPLVPDLRLDLRIPGVGHWSSRRRRSRRPQRCWASSPGSELAARPPGRREPPTAVKIVVKAQPAQRPSPRGHCASGGSRRSSRPGVQQLRGGARAPGA